VKTDPQMTAQVRLLLARQLAEAIERGDRQGEHEAAQAITGLYGHQAQQTLERIARDLRDALSQLRLCAQRAGSVRNGLPDAQLQLAQVLELTEQAAHQTLEAVEASLPLARGIVDSIGDFRMSCADALARDARLVALLEEIDGAAINLKSRLSEVLMAQGFQDITGQIIRRVVTLVSELESHLGDPAVPASGGSPGGGPVAGSDRGQGPARPGADRARVVGDQQDVDELLAGLGI
jgi:chemotaxis protein CheZ